MSSTAPENGRSPTLDLCVIARDEAALLPGLLASTAGVVDGVVVMDTGSVDDTPQIAAAAGARVGVHAWADDFAAARNAALAMSTADWVLVLDADERLTAQGGATLRQAIAQGGFDQGLLPLHNAARVDAPEADVLSGAARKGEPTLLARLFRRTPDLAWQGAIHERVTPSWPAGSARRGRTIHAPIIHLGYAPSLMAAKDKAGRNLRILRDQCDPEDPDPVPWSYLARDAARAGELDEASRATEAAWTRLCRVMASPAAGPPPAAFTVAALRGDQQLQRGDPAGALATAVAAAGWGRGHPNVDLIAGIAHHTLALRTDAPGRKRRHLTAAVASFSRCLDAHGQVYTDEVSFGTTSWLAACWLGEVHLTAGRPADAGRCFQAVLDRLSPNAPGLAGRTHTLALLGAAEARAGQDWAAGLAAAEPLLRLPIGDGWAIAAWACRRGGRRADAELLSKQGRGAGPLLAPRRAQLLQA